MSISSLITTLGSNFPSLAQNQTGVWGTSNQFGGVYVGENIILTAAHPLYDIRTTNSPPNPPTLSYVKFNQTGPLRNNGTVNPSNSVYVNPAFASFLINDINAGINPYSDLSIANFDTAYMMSPNTVRTRDLVGAGVFYGDAAATQKIINTAATLQSWQGVRSGTFDLFSPNSRSFSTNFASIPGDSGSGYTSSFRSVAPNELYIMGVQSTSTPSTGANGSLLTVSQFDSIMGSLSQGKSGNQSSQPRNYIHGSDNIDSIHGSFRPDAIFGNSNDDQIDDGDSGTAYWSDDYIYAGSGNDRLISGRGSDLMHGGELPVQAISFTTIATDGLDVVDYSQYNTGTSGIEIYVGPTAQSSIYSADPDFVKSIFVKDLNNLTDIDTLISIETVKGTSHSDRLKILDFNLGRLVGLGNQGGLSHIDFGGLKNAGEVDALDFSQINNQSVVFNAGQAVSYSTAPIWGPRPAYSASLAEGGLYAGQSTSSCLKITGSNYVIGTNQSSFNSGAWDDIFLGSSSVIETFEATYGNDLYVINPGDTLVLKQYDGQTFYSANWTRSDKGMQSLIEFNGMALDSWLWAPAGGVGGGIYTPVTGAPWQLELSDSTFTAKVTDLRDGSYFTIKNWVPYAFGFGVYLQNNASSSESIIATAAEQGSPIPMAYEGTTQGYHSRKSYDDRNVLSLDASSFPRDAFSSFSGVALSYDTTSSQDVAINKAASQLSEAMASFGEGLGTAAFGKFEALVENRDNFLAAARGGWR